MTTIFLHVVISNETGTTKDTVKAVEYWYDYPEGGPEWVRTVIIPYFLES